MTRSSATPSGAAVAAVALCCLFLLAREAAAIKFRMFPNLNPKECVSESVSEDQWDMVLESVEANFRKNAKRNLTDKEVAVRLASFRRPVQIEIGFITMSPNPSDQTMKPVDYTVLDSRGELLSSRTSVTQEEIDFEGHVGGKGPYTICFTANKEFGVVEIDLSYFLINCPESIGTAYMKSTHLSEEDKRDMKPVLTEEEMAYFLKEEHVLKLKGEMRSLGGSVYQTYYEQQHIKQLLTRGHRGIWFFAEKTKILGLVEAGLIVVCSVLQYVFVRRLFKSKSGASSLRGGLV